MIEPILKPKRHRGGKASRWQKFRKEWLKTQPCDFAGYYTCAKCGKGLLLADVEVDHIQRRSTHPHLVFEESNLQTLCHLCHVQKDGGMQVVQ